jgi:hypothetical protein
MIITCKLAQQRRLRHFKANVVWKTLPSPWQDQDRNRNVQLGLSLSYT